MQAVAERFDQQARRFLHLRGPRQFLAEFLFFGLKEATACLFTGLFFITLFASRYLPLGPLPRYDFILLIALIQQFLLFYFKIESKDEVKAIGVFHLIGLILEIFKTSPAIGSWSYPEFSYAKIAGVPLYSGFMYAAVAGYMVQAWRLFKLRITHHPPYWLNSMIALAIYLNFFTHHFIGDHRWWLIALVVLLYRKTTVYFTPMNEERRMPLLLSFVLIGFFVWVAENISTFFKAWTYPDQKEFWTMVHIGKWSSWSLLVILTFMIISHLKHIKKTIS